MPSRPDAPASYAIPVRRARTLPAASFRFRVTPDTLAVRLTVPVIRVRRGLAPPSHESATTADSMVLAHHAPCRAHTKKRGEHSVRPFRISVQQPLALTTLFYPDRKRNRHRLGIPGHLGIERFVQAQVGTVHPGFRPPALLPPGRHAFEQVQVIVFISG